MACVISSVKIGGFSAIFAEISGSIRNVNLEGYNLLLLISMIFHALLPAYGPEIVQRYLMARNMKELKSTFQIVTILSFFFAIALIIIVATVKYTTPSNIDPKTVLFIFIDDYLPIGLKGLMVAGLLAAVMSRAEAELSALGIIIANDLVVRIFPNISENTKLKVLRLSILLLATVALTPVSSSVDILDILWLFTNFYTPIIFVPLTAGLIGFKTGKGAFLSGTFSSLLVIIIYYIVMKEISVVSAMLGTFGSFLGFFGYHIFQKLAGIGNTYKHNFILPSPIRALSSVIMSVKFSILQMIKKQEQILKYKDISYLMLIIYVLCSVNILTFSSSFDIVVLCGIGYFICILMLVTTTPVIGAFIYRYIVKYQYAILTYLLPFTSTYIMLRHPGSSFWIIISIFLIFALNFFVDTVKFLLLQVVGFVTALSVFLVLHTRIDVGLYMSHFICILTSTLISSLIFWRKSQEEQDERINMMRAFGGIMGHDTKSPFASINMAIQTIHAILDSSNRIRCENAISLKFDEIDYDMFIDLHEKISTVSTRGVKVVNNLLATLRTEIVADDEGVYDVGNIVESSVRDFFELKEEYKNKKCSVNIVNNFETYISRSNLKQVIENLLKNSCKFGGPDVEISITIKDNTIYFRDNGNGIKEESLPQIFKKFYTTSKTSIGLGLPFCKLVIEKYNGYIEYESIPNQYTEFRITFPESLRC